MEKQELTKVTMNLSQRTIANVDEISKLIGIINRTRVVVASLELAKIILTQVEQGKKVILRDTDGFEQEIKFII
jgi:hypothetical protein